MLRHRPWSGGRIPLPGWAAGAGFAVLVVASNLGSLRAQTPTPVTLSANPAVVSFTWQVGAALPAEQKVAIKKSGTGAEIDFTITLGSPTANWLIVTPASLTAKTGSSISLRANPTPLTAGTYTTTLTISTASTDPISLPVTLVVKNPPPTMTVTTAGPLSFTYLDGGTAPSAQNLSVSTSGEPISVALKASNSTWLALDHASGVAVAGFPLAVSVSVNTTGLAPGTVNGTIAITSGNAANKTVSVNVTLTVNPAKAVIASIWPNPAPVGPNDITLTIRGSYFYASPTVKAGANVLTSTLVSNTVLLTVMPKTLLSTAGSFPITVSSGTQPVSDPFTLTVMTVKPQIQAVVNAASFFSGVPSDTKTTISPGEIISLFGSGLGPDTVVLADPTTATPAAFPTSLGQTQSKVTVEFELATGTWTAAPLIFAQAGQINAVAQFSMPTGKDLNLRVTYSSQLSDPFSFTAVDSNPGIFTTDSSGRGQAALLNEDYTLNSATNAATTGSTVMVFATGGGTMTPAPSKDGILITAAAPLTQTCSAKIGGVDAQVSWCGGPVGSVAGLLQVNVVVPSGLKANKAVPLIVTVVGRSSPDTVVTLAVK